MKFGKIPQSKSISRKMVGLISVLMIMQGLVFLGVITYAGTIRELRNNAYRELYDKTEARKNQIEGYMVKSWSLYTNYQAVLKSTQEDYQKSASKPVKVSLDTAKNLLYLMRDSNATGAFVLYDKPLEGTQRHPVFYVRDMEPTTVSRDNSDTLVEFGSSTLAKEMGLTLDTNWTEALELNENSDFMKHYMLLKETAQKHPEIEIQDLGRWSSCMRLVPDGIDLVTYCLPLRDENNQVYGMVGIEVSADYLYTLMPYDELADDMQGGYLLAIGNGTKTYTRVVANGPLYEGLLAENNRISLAFPAVNKENATYIMEDKHRKHIIYVTVCPMRLYNSNTPFEQERWTLLAMVKESALLASSQRLQIALLWAFVVAVGMGILGSVLVSLYFGRPIRQLALQLRKSSPEESILLPRVYITEIDQLAFAVEKFSADVAYSASRMTEILRIMDMPLGAIEYDKETDEIFCTELIGTLLDFREENRNRTVYSSSAFGKEMELFYQKATVFTDSVEHNKKEKYRAIHETIFHLCIQEESKWLNFKVLEYDKKTLTVVQDVTEQMQEKLKIEYERDYDVLTSLLNRRSFCKKVTRILQNPISGVGAMVMWDLDNLKYINDTYGHDFGDAYIMEAAKVLGMLQGVNCLVARMSGDEFLAFLYSYENKESIYQMVKEIHEKLHDTTLWLPKGEQVKIRASSGIAWYPEHAIDYDRLLKYADFAMYSAKSTCKGEIREFEEELFKRDELLFSGKEDLNRFIEEKQAKFAFQPIVSAKDGSVFAYEALMRPQEGNLKSIFDVMRLARAQSKLYQIEVLTVFGALEAYKEQQEAFGTKKIFVNSIPNTTLSEEDIQVLIQDHGDDLHFLVVEMIESEQVDKESYQLKRALAEKWKAEIALDDYGSGYNSEIRLLEMQPQYVKIDMSLIRDIDKDKDRQNLVAGIVSYLKPRQMKTIAEGIETVEEMNTILQLGIDYMQGYHLGRPNFEVKDIELSVKEEIQDFWKKNKKEEE